MVLYSFIPYIRTENDFELKNVQNNKDFMKIFEWYQTQIHFVSQICEITISNMYHLDNQIYFESNEDIDPYLLEDIIDPDNDGNYPITLYDNQLYLIFGKNLHIMNHS